mgnify:CR=1 FL=1
MSGKKLKVVVYLCKSVPIRKRFKNSCFTCLFCVLSTESEDSSLALNLEQLAEHIVIYKVSIIYGEVRRTAYGGKVSRHNVARTKCAKI